MNNDTRGAQFVRGLVKTVFIGCYAAFMWASIHHVAAFFDNFEQNGVSDAFGSYLLAGAIDITALVTTIGVMFFRKSMPRKIQAILWVFIVGLAIYSFFINWEYASHYQNTSLILQPTGQTTPVYDSRGQLHYVPVMTENLWLLYVNPALASCFTIFALIYSVVGEFFGAKAPTAEELKAKKKYLEETAGVMESIRQLEEKGRKPGIIQRAKQSALEIKDAVKEVTKQEETREDSTEESHVEETTKPERNTDKLTAVSTRKSPGNQEETEEKADRKHELTEEESMVVSYYEKTLSWLSASGTTVPLKVVSETMNQTMKVLNNRVESKVLQATKGKANVYKSSVVSWAIAELIPKENQKILPMKPRGNREENPNGNEEENNAFVDTAQRAMTGN